MGIQQLNNTKKRFLVGMTEIECDNWMQHIVIIHYSYFFEVNSVGVLYIKCGILKWDSLSMEFSWWSGSLSRRHIVISVFHCYNFRLL